MTAIVASDILWLASAPNASSGYTSSAQTTPEGCLGKYCSQNTIVSATLDNLFNDITGAENAAGQVDYQCVFVLNNTSTGNSMLNPVIWMPTAQYTSGYATIQFAIDQTAPSVKTSSAAQALVISAAQNVPSVSGGWSSPSASPSGGISCPNIPAGYVQAVWVKRTATNSAAVNNDQFGLQVTFDTNG